MNRSQAVLVIHPSDNVAVALEPLSIGRTIDLDGREIALGDEIPFGHKVAIAPIASGECAIKYGQPIGIAQEAIAPGTHVHLKNLKTRLEGREEYRYELQLRPLPTREDALTFRVSFGPAARWGSATNCGSCPPSAA